MTPVPVHGLQSNQGDVARPAATDVSTCSDNGPLEFVFASVRGTTFNCIGNPERSRVTSLLHAQLAAYTRQLLNRHGSAGA